VTAKTLLGLVVSLARETLPRLWSHEQQCGVTYGATLAEPNTGRGNTCKPFRLGNFGSKEESDFKTVLWERISELLAPLRS